MLARLARALPEGTGWRFEPKWDGFRRLVFRHGDAVDLRSRIDRPLARYFPELVEAVEGPPAGGCVLDGEILVVGLDFAPCYLRLHPSASEREVASGWLGRFHGGGVDGVVAGFRWYGGEPLVGSLLLGVHDAAGALRHVGVVTSMRRAELPDPAALGEVLGPS